MRKKGQMEIIGLVFIVILVAIGMLFYVRFGAKTDTNIKKDFVQKELVTSSLNALIQSRTDCGNLKFEDMIKHLASNTRTVYCDDYGLKTINPLEFLNETTTDIFNQTLSKWGKEYSLVVRLSLSDDNNVFKISESENFQKICSRKRKDSSLFFLPQEFQGKIYINLEICSTY